jgi:hypothetical protein
MQIRTSLRSLRASSIVQSPRLTEAHNKTAVHLIPGFSLPSRPPARALRSKRRRLACRAAFPLPRSASPRGAARGAPGWGLRGSRDTQVRVHTIPSPPTHTHRQPRSGESWRTREHTHTFSPRERTHKPMGEGGGVSNASAENTEGCNPDERGYSRDGKLFSCSSVDAYRTSRGAERLL